MSEKEPKDYWSDCEQVFFTGSKGYGLTENLQNICLGKEEDIKKFLDTGEVSNSFNSMQLEVLNQILIFRQEEGIGQSTTRAADMERAGDDGTSRRKPKATRLLTARKRLPLRPPRTKNKSLSRK